MDFYFPDFSARIDWRKRPRFRDKELAGLGVAQDVMVADIVVEVWLRGARQRQVLVHIEIQAQRDTALAQRVHDYNYRIGKTYGKPVNSMVLLADADPNWRPSSFLQHEESSARTFTFTTAKLLDYVGDVDALTIARNPIAWFTQAHLCTLQTLNNPDKRYAAKLHLTRLLFQLHWKRRRIIALFKAINWMMTLPESLERRFWRAILRLEKESEMKLLNPLEQMFFDDGIKKGLEQGLQQGRTEGRAEGRTEGRTEGAAALLERLLVQRFGPLPKAVCNKLAKASVTQIETWSDALATAQSLKQVFVTSD